MDGSYGEVLFTIREAHNDHYIIAVKNHTRQSGIYQESQIIIIIKIVYHVG